MFGDTTGDRSKSLDWMDMFGRIELPKKKKKSCSPVKISREYDGLTQEKTKTWSKRIEPVHAECTKSDDACSFCGYFGSKDMYDMYPHMYMHTINPLFNQIVFIRRVTVPTAVRRKQIIPALNEVSLIT